MSSSQSRTRRSRVETKAAPDRPGLGPALRRAWIGYHRSLDDAMAAAGFGNRGFPDGRVLRTCADADTTISDIGRELGITRQAASKTVAGLRRRGYVVLRASPTDAREKIVRPTSRAHDFLAAQRQAARAIERRLRAELGQEGFESLYALLGALGGSDEPRMREYLRAMGVREL